MVGEPAEEAEEDTEYEHLQIHWKRLDDAEAEFTEYTVFLQHKYSCLS